MSTRTVMHDGAILDSWAQDMMTLPDQFLRRFIFSDLIIFWYR